MSKAGLFAGEVTPIAPADEEPTDKPRNYVWMEYGDIPPPPPTPYIAKSGQGFAITRNLATQTPAFAHPYNGEVWDEITISAVFRTLVEPSASFPYALFNINEGSPDFSAAIRRRTNGQYYIAMVIVTDVGLRTITDVSFELTTVFGWEWFHWYWIGFTYDFNTGQTHAWIRNLTLQQEGSAVAAIDNLAQIEWIKPQGSSSYCMWGTSDNLDLGGGPAVAESLHGPGSQVMIHNKYIDLSVLANRDKFCHIDGVINIGPSGEIPFGEIPDVYLPRGLGIGNLGTRFIGDPADFYILESIAVDSPLPPVSATP